MPLDLARNIIVYEYAVRLVMLNTYWTIILGTSLDMKIDSDSRLMRLFKD